jgi:alkylation response protein AidB-like acyl-CoA dehydrogenase
MTSCDPAADLLARAREIAETVLFPGTLAVDAAEVVPAGHLDLLAGEGFYGIAAPPEAGGPGANLAATCAIVETFASACLCTTFVWMQHHGVVLRLAGGKATQLRADWLPRLVTGERRAGVALGGTLPGEPVLVARRGSDGYVLIGYSPWVTGWHMVDVLAVAARDGDTLVWALLDARESDTLVVEPLRMVAVSASNTVTVRFTEHPVPADRLIGRQDYSAWARADAEGLRMNGSLALGVTSRCATLLGPGPLDAELAACRTRLDMASAAQLPDARAQASALAARAANTLVASTGSRAILLDSHAQKLAREALFLLVFASRPGIKQALRRLLITPPAP